MLGEEWFFVFYAQREQVKLFSCPLGVKLLIPLFRTNMPIV